MDLFLNLCRINCPSLAEREVVAWTKAYLVSMGLDVREDHAGAQIGGNANNLIATLPATQPGLPRIFLSAHFDTVEPTPNIEIVEENGVFRALSDTILGADDKGGMAPAIEAVQALMESGEPHGDVFLLLSVAEEIGLKGADALNLEELHLDFGYVLDSGPPVGTYVTRTASHDSLDVTITGRPAHAGKDPEKGINAIQVAASAIEGMLLGRIGPETTANLGQIRGGMATNVVCPMVNILAEARSTSLAELDAQTDHMIRQFEEAAVKFGATVEIHHVRDHHAYKVPGDSHVVQIAERASAALNLPFALRTTLGGSDANVYNRKGVPCIVVGTGMDLIHTHDERISRADLVKTAELALQLLREANKKQD